MIKFECDFVGGQHGCTCIAMGKKQYSLHSHIAFTPPIKLVRSLAYPINPTHDNIAAADQQYHNNLHGYHLVNKINSPLKKISVAAINEKWIKGAKDMVMGYAIIFFVELMYWVYVRYRKITPRDLMRNQDKMQTMITHGCGSSHMYIKHTWTGKISNKRQERRDMGAPTM